MIIYEPGQVANIYPFIDFVPGWFLLGGPADASEAHEIRDRFPDIAIIGFEPNPLFYNLQLARGFPGRLLPVALWENERKLEIKTVPHVQGFWMEQRSGSATKFNEVATRVSCVADATTLDTLDTLYGPFEDAILWIDIEESEIYCLRGAVGLMAREKIRLINAEVHSKDVDEIADFLGGFGIKEVHRWNTNTRANPDGSYRYWWNIIYRLF